MTVVEVADRVYRVSQAYVSCYLVEDAGRVLLVDAGLPAMWSATGDALARIGRRPSDVVGVALTHTHFDHLGFAARVRTRLGVPVWADPRDAALAAHPYRYLHERARSPYALRHPRCLPVLAAMVRAGALRVAPVRDTVAYDEAVLAGLPGAPRLVPTPGHTFGHVALHLPGRDALLTGDALVTLDPYTGAPGPQIVAGAATADSTQALRSLDALEATGARVLLPGHGEPWTEGVARAVAEARLRGAH
jgi:glyoxylase-like metal-dependent hydrolase (beta-lactamase superfamily II)